MCNIGNHSPLKRTFSSVRTQSSAADCITHQKLSLYKVYNKLFLSVYKRFFFVTFHIFSRRKKKEFNKITVFFN